MKTIKRIILLVALTLAAYAAHAQSGYYHQVGDTVRGKCPIYHYEHGWWPVLNATGHTDSLINTAFSTFGYMKHTTNTPLKVIGVASTWARLDKSDPSNIHEDLDANIEGPMYYVLCDATASGLVELTRVCWTDDYMTHPKRYMELPLKTGFCSNMEDHDTIVSLREYYFDSAITVTDSFYLGCVVPDIDASGPNGFAIFFCNKQTYLLRKTLVQQHYFIECMHRFQAISLLQISRQNFPERLIVLGFLDHHTCLQGLFCPTFSDTIPRIWLLTGDGCR